MLQICYISSDQVFNINFLMIPSTLYPCNVSHNYLLCCVFSLYLSITCVCFHWNHRKLTVWYIQVEKWNEQREHGTFPGPLWMYRPRPPVGPVNKLARQSYCSILHSYFQNRKCLLSLALQPVTTKLLVMPLVCSSNNLATVAPHAALFCVWTVDLILFTFCKRLNGLAFSFVPATASSCTAAFLCRQ